MLATKYELPLHKIEEIVNHQFKFAEKIMKQGDFDSIRLPYFGKFSVNPNRVKHINKLKDAKNET
jgi:nucleoid DNA-binding protein